ncbi:MAG: Thiolase, C-terminal domain-containing protein, partial [Olpidium bornovanus]
ICDGAAAVVVASEDAVQRYGLKPLARVVSWHAVGVEPTVMGLGPVNAIKGALKKAKLSLDDMNIIEVNEAFAAQFLAVARELNLDPAAMNPNGGAIAVGHPLAASGSRILGHLAYLLNRKNEKYAVGSACIGGGQWISRFLLALTAPNFSVPGHRRRSPEAVTVPFLGRARGAAPVCRLAPINPRCDCRRQKKKRRRRQPEISRTLRMFLPL